MKKTAVTLLVALLAQPCFAISDEAPAHCPSIAMVKLVGVDKAYYDASHGWLVTTNYSQYDTDVMWSFSMLVGGKAQSAEEAVYLAKYQLRQISNVIGPFNYEKSGQTIKRWGCSYFGDEGFAMAITPTLPE